MLAFYFVGTRFSTKTSSCRSLIKKQLTGEAPEALNGSDAVRPLVTNRKASCASPFIPIQFGPVRAECCFLACFNPPWRREGDGSQKKSCIFLVARKSPTTFCSPHCNYAFLAPKSGRCLDLGKRWLSPDKRGINGKVLPYEQRHRSRVGN